MNSQDPKRNTIPSLLLEQWRLGELAEERKMALIEEFGEAYIQQTLAQLEAEEAAFRPPPLMGKLPSQELPKRPSWTRKMTPWLAAAAVIVLMVFGLQPQDVQEPNEVILLKGDSAPLTAYQQLKDQIVKVTPDQHLKEGDVIQFSYDAAEYSFGAIVSLDGRGQLTWLFPEDPGIEGRLTPGKRTVLDHAYKLDDAPNFERFFLIRSHRPIDPVKLEETLRQAGKLGQPETDDPALDIFSFSIRK